MPVVINGTTGIQTVGIDASGNATLASLAVNSNKISAVNSLGFRNRIINGDMRIAQRATSGTATNGGYPSLDRYQTFTETADGVFTVAQSADAPAGFTNSALITVTTADSSIGAAQRYLFLQNIEGLNVSDLGFGAAGATTVTLSFWIKSSVTGAFGGTLCNASFDRSYPFSYTINAANTWEYKTVTIPGDTTGTWLKDNGLGFRLMFSLGAGSSVSAPANTWGTSGYQPTGSTALMSTLNATWRITGLQLEPGNVATPYERVDYGRQLIQCQRYYQIVGSFQAATAQNSETYLAGAYAMYCPMRAGPTAVGFTGSFHRPGIAFYNIVSIDGIQGADGANYTSVTIASGTGTGCPGQFSGTIKLNAEL